MGANKESEWVPVVIPRNRFSLGDGKGSPAIQGYIHRSRVYPIETIPEYEGSDFSFEYVIEDFTTKGKVIQYLHGAVHRINGRQIHGHDLSTPGKQIKEVRVTIEEVSIPIHPIFFEDIFACDNDFTVHKMGELFIVHQWNSDGAGAYEIVWVLDK
ncbi:MAG: hypothetical protein AAF399_17060 [Bacteroidota bacterium]